MKQQKPPCRKKSYQKIGFDLKLLIIDQIQNGRISVNYAADSLKDDYLFWLEREPNFTNDIIPTLEVYQE